MNSLDEILIHRPPTADRPLLGLTVLLVEDSRYAAEGVKLLCQRSGARLRRADSLQTARRHLASYRPSVVIVDLGLPDGAGDKLIAELAASRAGIDALLGLSAEPDNEAIARAAGADGFLLKPIGSLAAFQSAILSHLPADRQPRGPRLVPEAILAPDPASLHDDLTIVAEALRQIGRDPDSILSVDYLARFVGGVALSAGDRELREAAGALARAKVGASAPEIARLADLIAARLARSGPL